MKNNILIHFEENAYNLSKDALQLQLQELNYALELVENFTNSKLSNTDAILFKEQPKVFLTEWINSTTDKAFILSPLEFKLDTRGLRDAFNNIIDYANLKSGVWDYLECNYQNNRFELKKEVLTDLKNQCSTFAITNEAKEKYYFLTELATILNKGFDNNFFANHIKPSLIAGFNGNFKFEVPTGENEYKIVLNHNVINVD